MRAVLPLSITVPILFLASGLLLATGEQTGQNSPLPTSSPSELSATTTREIRNADTIILVYHIVRPSRKNDTAEMRKISVTPELFSEQMRYLIENKYTIIPFSRLEDYLSGSTTLPDRSVVLTFDDALSCQHEYALPILKELGLTATFFVPSNYPGHGSFLSWSNLKDLIRAGMTIGSHSVSHPYMNEIRDKAKLEHEIRDSKAKLERNLGITIREFAYPFGQFNATSTELVRQAGYASGRAYSYYPGNTAENMYALHALPAPTDMAKFKMRFPASQ